MIAVRPVTPSDHAGWLPLWRGYNAFYGRSGETALADDVTASTWARFLDADEPVHGLVAEGDGRLLGLAHCVFHRNTILREPTCYMQDLFTHEEARGRGVGRRLIEAVYDLAAAAGISSVYWHTRHDNVAAMRLYDGLATNTGFVVYRHKA